MKSILNTIYAGLAAITLFFSPSTAEASSVANSSQIVIDPSGNAVTIWVDNLSTHTVIEASIMVAGVWSAPIILSPAGVNSFAPRIVVNSASEVVAVWGYDDMVNNVIALASSSILIPSGSWSVPATISSPTESILSGMGEPNTKLVMNNSGDIVVSWTSKIVATGDIVVRNVTGTQSSGVATWNLPLQLSL